MEANHHDFSDKAACSTNPPSDLSFWLVLDMSGCETSHLDPTWIVSNTRLLTSKSHSARILRFVATSNRCFCQAPSKAPTLLRHHIFHPSEDYRQTVPHMNTASNKQEFYFISPPSCPVLFSACTLSTAAPPIRGLPLSFVKHQEPSRRTCRQKVSHPPHCSLQQLRR